MDAAVASPTSLSGSRESSSAKEGALLYRAGSTYLGKEVWKSCYLVLRYRRVWCFKLFDRVSSSCSCVLNLNLLFTWQQRHPVSVCGENRCYTFDVCYHGVSYCSSSQISLLESQYKCSFQYERCPLINIYCMFACDCLCLCCRGGHCGGCRRSNSSEKPHAFQVILTEHPPLELSAENELEMADWMQLLCQSVSKGVSCNYTHTSIFASSCKAF